MFKFLSITIGPLISNILVNELEHELVANNVELEFGVLAVVNLDVQVGVEVARDLDPIHLLVPNLNLILVVDLDTFEIVLGLVDDWLELDVNQVDLVLRFVLLLDLPWLDIVVGVVVVVVHIDEVLDDVDVEVVVVLAIEPAVLDVLLTVEDCKHIEIDNLDAIAIELINIVADVEIGVVDEFAIELAVELVIAGLLDVSWHIDARAKGHRLEDLAIELIELVVGELVGLDLIKLDAHQGHHVVNHLDLKIEVVDLNVDDRVHDCHVLDGLVIVHPVDDLDALSLVVGIDTNASIDRELLDQVVVLGPVGLDNRVLEQLDIVLVPAIVVHNGLLDAIDAEVQMDMNKADTIGHKNRKSIP